MADGYKLYVPCPGCGGSGKIFITEPDGDRWKRTEVNCNVCTGHGIKFSGWCTVDIFPMPTPEE